MFDNAAYAQICNIYHSKYTSKYVIGNIQNKVDQNPCVYRAQMKSHAKQQIPERSPVLRILILYKNFFS